jgi:G3E family GTPase
MNLSSRLPVTVLSGFLGKLNPSARILTTERGNVSLTEVLATNLFDMEKARSSRAGSKELNQVHTPEIDEYKIGSFIFRARRPFHPERFWNFVL